VGKATTKKMGLKKRVIKGGKMKDRDKIANMLQNQIMELVKSLNDIGYNFKLTHNGIASEIRKSDTFEAPSDDGWEVSENQQLYWDLQNAMEDQFAQETKETEK